MTIAEYTLRIQELSIAAFHTVLFLAIAFGPPILAILAYKEHRDIQRKKVKP